MSTTSAATILADLEAAIRGRIVRPGDRDYDALREVSGGGVDRRPALFVCAVDDADVAAAVVAAREAGIPIAVRGGGHGVGGLCVMDDCLVIDQRDRKGIDIDLPARTLTAEAGATAGEVTDAAAAHGLAVGFGDTRSVGITGITLGGGVGYLSRRFGLTIDALLAADVVTADGQLRHVDADHHPDLFWAIRGGGGNFGVVTRLTYQLQEVGEIYGGLLLLPATAEVVAGVVAAADAAPDELGNIINVVTCPPLPFLPEQLHGQLVVMAQLCWSGAIADGPAAIASFRALAEPLADLIQPMPYPGMLPPEMPVEVKPIAVSTTMFLDRVGLDEAQVMLDHLAASDAMMRAVQLRVLGGAIARVSADATAYAHRDSRIMANVAAFCATPAERDARTAWVTTVAGDLRQSDTGAYVNFLGLDGAEGVRAAYPGATWDRLVAVKTAYDPGNVFRHNQNIPPATSTTLPRARTET